MRQNILLWYSKSYFRRNILFWHEEAIKWNSVGIIHDYCDCHKPLIFLSRKIPFWHSKSYFDIRTELENPILIFKILFRHSHSVGISYFDIQNPILTFAVGRKILFWYSKFYYDIRYKSEYPIVIFKILFQSEYPILAFKILFRHSNWVGISYFDI